MRNKRVKEAKGIPAIYHCISHLISRTFLTIAEKHHFRNRMWRLAKFLGFHIITYSVLDTHYHIEMSSREEAPMDDKALLDRVSGFYGADSAQAQVLRDSMTALGHIPESFRRKYLNMFGDISLFNKMLKQGYTVWYNHLHDLKGTLWQERFKSILVQSNAPEAEKIRVRLSITVALYIDLNAVRAGIVGDPKDYIFCGYAEAVAGDGPAREGLMSLFPGKTWEQVEAIYRQLLFSRGAESRKEGKKTIPVERVLEVLKNGGRMKWSELCCFKVKYLFNGGAIGSKEFVEGMFKRFWSSQYPNARTTALPAAGIEGAWYMGQRRRGCPIIEPRKTVERVGN